MFVQTLLHSTLSVMCTALIAVSASCFFYSLAFLFGHCVNGVLLIAEDTFL